MLPLLKTNLPFEEKIIKVFKGINTQENYSAGEIRDEVNMTDEMFPSLCTRNGRKNVFKNKGKINGAGNFNGLIYTYYTDDNKIFLHFEDEDFEFTSVSYEDFEAKRSFASLSDTIMIIPDNLIFSTKSRTFIPININLTGSKETLLQKFAEESKNSNILNDSSQWHLGNISHNKITSRQFSYNSSSGSCTFYYFAFPDSLKSGDVITVKMNVQSDKATSGSEYTAFRNKMKNGLTLKIKDVTVSDHKTANGEITETTELIFDDNTIDINGYSDLVFSNITIERKVPELKSICSFNNRIWGITANELCCSKLADASEWNDFTTDAYGTMPYACFSTPASTEGEFTAITGFGNYIYAFKENSVHRLYGETPDEFALKTIETSGIPENKKLTLARTASSLFYCNGTEILSMSDTGAKKISLPLGKNLNFICGWANPDKYYIVTDENGINYIYVYNPSLDIWHRENTEEHIKYLSGTGAQVVAVCDESITYIDVASGQADPEKTNWNFSLHFDEKMFSKKSIGKISIRYSLGENAFFTVQTIYDDETKGALCGAHHDETIYGNKFIHIPVRRCTSFKLNFSGMGYFCLKSLKIKYFRGSEI